MTDAREALRETVARELANDMGEVVDRAWKFYLRGADAAIDLVLEEAEKAIKETKTKSRAIAAIRALKSST